MKKIFTVALVIMGLMMASNQVNAQSKIGYISLQELISAMPEYKKAESDMSDYQKALAQQGDDYQKEFSRKDSVFGNDSAKWSPAVRDVKRKELNELYLKAVNFNQQAQQLMNNKEQELIAPIQRRAIETTQAVAKENGYGYVFSKEQLISYPSGDDLLPLVAKKLNLKVGAAAEGEKAPARPVQRTPPVKRQ